MKGTLQGYLNLRQDRVTKKSFARRGEPKNVKEKGGIINDGRFGKKRERERAMWGLLMI